MRLVMSIAANGSSTMSASCSLAMRSSATPPAVSGTWYCEGVVARAIGAAEMAAQRIAVADEAVVRERDARMVLADGRGAIVARAHVDLERPPLRDAHPQHALAERLAGLELGIDALDERIVLQISQAALHVGQVDGGVHVMQRRAA